MASSFGTMLVLIDFTEVVPSAYNKFVEYIVTNLKPTTKTIANAFANDLSSSIKASIVFAFIICIFVVLLIMILFVEGSKDMSSIVAIFIFILFAVVLSVLFLSVSNVATVIAKDEAVLFQDTVAESTLYALNSSLRDAIYLALCK